MKNKSVWILLLLTVISIAGVFVTVRRVFYFLKEHPPIERQAKSPTSPDSMLNKNKSLIP